MATYDLTSVSMPTVLEMDDVLNCPYTGDKVSITLPAGRYCLECWGAQGGYRSSTEDGGKGGYSKGILTLKEATEVFLYAGGQGGTSSVNASQIRVGGFNGGGYRYGYYGGGGASDIRIGRDSLYARVIVAGGGGSDGSVARGGGAGGGISGQTTPATNYDTGGLGGQSTHSGTDTSTTATTQATSGLDTSIVSLTYGGFGFGGAGLFVNDSYGGSYGGAGGGGWYGGQGTLPDDPSDDDKGGGGGSGFVYTKNTVSSIPIGYLLSGKYYLTQAETKQGTTSFISPNNITEMGHSGDGYIRITVVENINDLRRRKSARIQQKGSSSTEWDPDTILLSREIGIETDTNKMKIGDGITPWSSLPYCNNSASDEEIKRIKYYGDPDIVPSDESYFTVNKTGETITGLTDAGKTQTELVIPYKINGVEIRCIGSNAFNFCTSLISVNIPNSVTSIDGGTFADCTSLISVNIPNSVTSIGDYAFYNCSRLTSITIPDSVTSIGSYAFYYCYSLTSINIPNSVTSIGNNAFGSIYLTIYCEQGSYADTFAQTNNIPVMYTDVCIDKTIVENSENAISGGAVFTAISEINNSITDDVSIAKEIAQSVRTDADNGVFNGKDGADYIITEADKEEIKADVVETLTRSSTALPEMLDVNTIYDLGEQDALTLNLPSGKLGDFIEVDFLSTQTPTTLTITASAGMSDYDLIPEANTIYSLYFNWIRLDVENYGWGFGYAEYTRTVTE